ncbi:hypothetical protein E6W36_13510 [Hankyongella ginsenosidimutans]|uniref:ComEC/Rec2-related protein domain-containing protein n=1 Tax=Hankyongella ginsenosidimutans TaxID=1763828 RepID=A0A4D7CC19_9SPHN|nr:hypothetical protein E6W36_13510 [Hankyongella ginsenosidimutans]
MVRRRRRDRHRHGPNRRAATAFGPHVLVAAPRGAAAKAWRADPRSDPGCAGAVAAALVTGERAPIPAWVETAMRNSGLTHLLSISGLHIAVVAGLAFLTVRKTLLLNPWVGLHWPVKAIAILASAIAALAYTLLSGASWPTVRACLATLVVLLGTLAGRQAISCG